MASPPQILQPSRLVHATVFSDAAHVTRRVEADVEAGLTRLAVPDLPSDLDVAQLRVTPSRGRVRFVEVDDLDLSPNGDAPAADERARAEAEQAVHRLTGEQDALAAELELIDRVVPGRGLEAPASGVLRPDVFLAGLDTLTKRRRELLYATRVVEYQLHLAKETLADMVALEEAGSVTREDLVRQSALVVGLDLDEPGQVQVELTYTAGWASWRPYYALRLEPRTGQIEVARFADLWQTTREDWTQVSLRLSTSEPETGLVLPEVLPWILERRRGYSDDARHLYRRRAAPLPPRSTIPTSGPPSAIPAAASSVPPESMATLDLDPRDLPGDVMDAYGQQYEEEGIFAEISSSGLSASRAGGVLSSSPPDDLDDSQSLGALPPPPPPRPGPRRWRPPPDHPDLPRLLEHAKPRAASGGIDFELDVPGTFTCRAGRDRQRVGLGARSYPAEVTYLLRPGVKDHAFGRATLLNEEATPLLTGPAALFVEDAYFGTSRLLTTPAGGKLVLDLGAEPGIECARRAHTEVRTEGLINKEDVHRVQITVEIESFLDRPVSIEVQDQLPVSGDPKVKVELQKMTPRYDEADERTGILTWRFELEPGRTHTIELIYEIEAPKDYQLVQSLGATP